ncbi:hypothetical protein HK101_002082, partial [Irineochytrium annulatum]
MAVVCAGLAKAIRAVLHPGGSLGVPDGLLLKTTDLEIDFSVVIHSYLGNVLIKTALDAFETSVLSAINDTQGIVNVFPTVINNSLYNISSGLLTVIDYTVTAVDPTSLINTVGGKAYGTGSAFTLNNDITTMITSLNQMSADTTALDTSVTSLTSVINQISTAIATLQTQVTQLDQTQTVSGATFSLTSLLPVPDSSIVAAIQPILADLAQFPISSDYQSVNNSASSWLQDAQRILPQLIDVGGNVTSSLASKAALVKGKMSPPLNNFTAQMNQQAADATGTFNTTLGSARDTIVNMFSNGVGTYMVYVYQGFAAVSYSDMFHYRQVDCLDKETGLINLGHDMNVIPGNLSNITVAIEPTVAAFNLSQIAFLLTFEYFVPSAGAISSDTLSAPLTTFGQSNSFTDWASLGGLDLTSLNTALTSLLASVTTMLNDINANSASTAQPTEFTVTSGKLQYNMLPTSSFYTTLNMISTSIPTLQNMLITYIPAQAASVSMASTLQKTVSSSAVLSPNVKSEYNTLFNQLDNFSTNVATPQLKQANNNMTYAMLVKVEKTRLYLEGSLPCKALATDTIAFEDSICVSFMNALDVLWLSLAVAGLCLFAYLSFYSCFVNRLANKRKDRIDPETKNHKVDVEKVENVENVDGEKVVDGEKKTVTVEKTVIIEKTVE